MLAALLLLRKAPHVSSTIFSAEFEDAYDITTLTLDQVRSARLLG